MLRQTARQRVPRRVYRPILTWWRRPRPVRWGSLRRLTPVSRVFGFDRGLPLDRHYIEDFLRTHSADIAGRVRSR
jgi:hypothetical protein